MQVSKVYLYIFQIQALKLQLLHRESRLFVFNLFQFNYLLLYDTILVTTDYIIIIVQLQMSNGT